MNAVNPASSTPPDGGDQRLYEPSMEEILASIRRIIADDQMIPPRAAHRDFPSPDGHALAATAEASVVPGAILTSHRPAPVVIDASPEPMRSVPAAEPAGIEATNHTPPGEASAPEALSVSVSTAVSPEVSAIAMAAVAASVIPDEEPVPHAVHRQPIVSPTHEPAAKPFHHGADDAEFEDPAEDSDPFGSMMESNVSTAKAEPLAALFSSHTNQAVSSAFNVLAATRLADNSEELLGLAREMIRPLLKTWLDDNLPSMVERMVRAEIERVARGGR